MKNYLILIAFLTACGAPPQHEASDVTLGDIEQPISAWFAHNSSGTRKASYGVCDNRDRYKCRPDMACSGGAACIVPRSTIINYCFSGPDGDMTDSIPPHPANPNGYPARGWKDEFRRAFDIINSFSDAYGMSWQTNEQPCAFAQFEIVNADVLCHQGGCGWDAHNGYTYSNFVEFFEPAMTTLTEKKWTQNGLVSGSYPGTYKRRSSSSSKTYVYYDENSISAIAREEGGASYDTYIGTLHYVHEHGARWTVFQLLGIGSMYPSEQWPTYEGTTIINSMNPHLWSPSGPSGNLGSWNASNWLAEWEDCQWRGYSPSDLSTFWQAPAGCIIP